jgi:hypothetical protein
MACPDFEYVKRSQLDERDEDPASREKIFYIVLTHCAKQIRSQVDERDEDPPSREKIFYVVLTHCEANETRVVVYIPGR